MTPTPDHDILIELRESQKRVMERVDAIYRTLFGEDGRDGLAADVTEVRRTHRWLCPIVIGLLLIIVAAGGEKVLAWALKAL
jgi:hypothetical protein